MRRGQHTYLTAWRLLTEIFQASRAIRTVVATFDIVIQ